jgi:hypothetical protein
MLTNVSRRSIALVVQAGIRQISPKGALQWQLDYALKTLASFLKMTTFLRHA